MAMNVFACTYVHALEGRLRIKLPGIKRAPRKAQEVELRLRQLSGVAEVTANPVTGNVLILYHPGALAQEEIIFFLMESGYLSQPVAGGRINEAPSTLEKVAASVATTVIEGALLRLVGALI